MNLNLLPRFLVSLGLAASGSLGLANGWSGCGGDEHLIRDNVWYLGEEPVKYCVARDPSFRIASEELRQMTRDALDQWRDFFSRYGLADRRFGEASSANAVTFPDGLARRMALNFSEVDCGSGDDPELLHIYFGVKNDVISSYLAMNSQTDPVGLALRRDYNHATYRTGGYVYIAPFSGEASRIKHSLLHELGHVFGMPHDSVFVMDEDVAYQVQDTTHFTSEYFGRIESATAPYRLAQGRGQVLTDRTGFVASPDVRCDDFGDFASNRTLPQELREILDLPPQGCHRLTLTPLDAVAPGRFSVELKIETLTGRVAAVRGEFETSSTKPKDSPSPGIVTNWKTADGRTVYRRAALDGARRFLPARGELQFGGARRTAARLDDEDGLSLEIFLPRSGAWWVTKAWGH